MEALMRSLLSRNEEFVVDKLQSLLKNEENVEIQKQEIDSLTEDIEKLKEENHGLKNKLENKRDIIEDLEYDIDNSEKKYKDVKLEMEEKENKFDELEKFLAKQVEEIVVLRDNNYSMINQISENVRMEKKIEIQNGIIKELKGKMNNVENINKTNFTEETDDEKEALEREVIKLASEVEELQLEIKQKICQLDCLQNKNEKLTENFRKEDEHIHVENAYGSTFSEELHLVGNSRNSFQCELCGESFGKRSNLKNHVKENHTEESEGNILTTQLNMLETKILSQKSNLFSNLLELKEKEYKWICNWKKPISSEILNKSRSILGVEESEAKGFKCQSCRNSFESPEGLETHLQTMHSNEILVDC